MKQVKDILSRAQLGKDKFFIFLLAGILLFVIAIPVDKETSKSNQENEADTGVDKQSNGEFMQDGEALQGDTSTISYAKQLEKALEETLCFMDGVGAVKAMVTLKSSKEQVVEKDIPNRRNSVTETDAEGGNRNTLEAENEETTIYMTDADGKTLPYVVKELEPQIEGVMIVAQGGANATVSKNITEAIQALFGIEAHKIKVVKMKGNTP